MSSPVRKHALWAMCGGVGGGGVSGGSARRCLFGPVNHVALQDDYRQMMKVELEEASQRWSFDFTADKPRVGGDFEWVKLPSIQVPFLYRQCTVGTEPWLKGVLSPSDPQNEDAGEPAERNDRSAHSAEKHTLKRKQTNITDFYQTKRRVVTARKSGQ